MSRMRHAMVPTMDRRLFAVPENELTVEFKPTVIAHNEQRYEIIAHFNGKQVTLPPNTQITYVLITSATPVGALYIPDQDPLAEPIVRDITPNRSAN